MNGINHITEICSFKTNGSPAIFPLHAILPISKSNSANIFAFQPLPLQRFCMNTRELLSLYRNHPAVRELSDKLESGKFDALIYEGLSGSSLAFPLTILSEMHPMLIICADEETAGYLKSDLDAIGEDGQTAWLKSSYRKPFQSESIDPNLVQERAELMLALSEKKAAPIIVTWIDAVAEMAVSQELLRKNQIEISTGETLDLDFMMEALNEYQFSREDFVYEPGQYAIRGGIIDIYSFSHEQPYRLELDGRLIESIRLFDPVSQLSIKEVRLATLVPNIQLISENTHRISFFDYLTEDVLMVLPDSNISIPHYKDIFETAFQNEQLKSHLLERFETPDVLSSKIKGYTLLSNSIPFQKSVSTTVKFDSRPQPTFNRQFNLITEHFEEVDKSGGKVLVFSETSKQIERLYTIFDDLQKHPGFLPVYRPLSKGFFDRTLNLAFYTEHELFGRHFQYRSKTRFSKNQAITLKELSDLIPGDFVVHVDHGIGQFQGLQKIEVGGRRQEAVRILYKNGDLLYVNIQALHKISKYTGKEGTEPKLNKLGSDAWQNLKAKTKKQVKDIARDLIKLYASRKAQPGFSYAPDGYLQHELEASFLYEDTPDQSKATDDFKKDMESPHPMDRLICGDVGFGKTEVAIRAAFKAACDSKQVAVLVPTTILAQQHFRTFRSRLEGFPVHIDYINRFRTAKQQKETLQKLKEGKVDIIIGTHRLLGKDVEFKDLGLLIIDEEQKFGVGAKEKLKQLRVNVDTLTLTATPIPRTLHFSLMGARDLSVINTPPPNRQPVKTELHTFSKEMLKSAVEAEVNRGGQVFVVHNRVKDIEDLADLIRVACPGVRVAVAHGQMPGDDLENIMVRFVEAEYDVLVATTIIESGLDIPNANTIIINNAHYFGLSDLHQMRGRVGRSNRKAFCYLFCPPVYTLSDDARRRLLAIEEFSDLGSGFNVAMRDLDIRGAGNLLGGEQSGFIAEIGFDMYHKILDEAIHEIKHDEFSDVFEDEEENRSAAVVECQVETDLDAMIPDEYIRNISERLSLYSELSRVKNKSELEAFYLRLKDRFGPAPRQIDRLLDSVKLKWMGEAIGFEKIVYKNKKLSATFTTKDDFFTSELFTHIISVIQKHSRTFTLKQGKNNLMLVCDSVQDITEVLLTLQMLIPSETEISATMN